LEELSVEHANTAEAHLYCGFKTFKLKNFTDANLTMVPNSQDMVLGFEKGASGRLFTSKAWKEISGVKDAIKAALNYMQLSRHFHPLDSGPQVLYKVQKARRVALTPPRRAAALTSQGRCGSTGATFA
jgi:hypothetical protein